MPTTLPGTEQAPGNVAAVLVINGCSGALFAHEGRSGYQLLPSPMDLAHGLLKISGNRKV